MAYLGELNRSETIRLTLSLDNTPTGTPQVGIDKQGVEVLAETNMSGSGLEWYYDYTIGGAATIGAYQVRYTATISGVGYNDYDSYNISVASMDTIKTETASIQTDTTSIETKVDTVDANVDTIKDTDLPAVKTDTAAILVDTGTTLPAAIDAVPTVGEIDTELTTEHGAGSCVDTGAGSGLNNITVHCKDGSAVDIPGVKVTVHNTANDDTPVIAVQTSDANGDAAVTLDNGTYTIRGHKAGYTFSNIAPVVSGSATVEIPGVGVTITAPSDPDLCRLYLFPITLGNADITDLASNLIIKSKDNLTKINDEFISNTQANFTYDSSTDPDSYYFDAVQGVTVTLTSSKLGVNNKSFVVPEESTYDIYDLI